MKRGCDVASHPRIDNTKAKTAERYGTQMSRSEDYLDQLLKGVAPGSTTEAEPEQDTSEENLFSDILEEFAGDTEEESVSEDMFDDEDIFGDDFFDVDIDEDFLREFEMELEEPDEMDISEDAEEPVEFDMPNVQTEPEELEIPNVPEEPGMPELSELLAEASNESAEVEETGDEEDVMSLFDDLDSILSGTNEQTEAEPGVQIESLFGEEPEPAFEMDAEPTTEAEPAMGGDFSFADLFADDAASDAEETPQEDPDVLKILEGLDGIDLELEEEDGVTSEGSSDFSALEGFLAASAAAEPLPEESDSGLDIDLDGLDFGESAETESATAEEPKKGKKEKKNGEKAGFMNKLGLILFGEDEEDEEDDFTLFKKKGAGKAKGKAKAAPAAGPAEQGNVSIGAASDDDLALFGEYSGTSASAAPAEEEPKKGKKEKKKTEKKEKVKKEKKPRPKKEKKPKKPKEPDNTPPLPKKPVFLIFLMVASLVALVLLGADLLGYSNQLNNAKNQYAKKNYSEAFAEISGMEIKEDDMALYNKYHVMAMVSVELEAYESLMSQQFYDMALDCLVRTVGRAEKYRADAENYGCIQELNELELKAETILSETFGVSKEEALEFYSYRSKREYSTALAEVIKELGLEKVTE